MANKFKNNLKMLCLVLFTGGTLGFYIYTSLVWQPAKVIHPDAIHFMNIFQEQYEKINTLNDFPKVIYTAFRNCNHYDWNPAILILEIDHSVGWVEQRETQQI